MQFFTTRVPAHLGKAIEIGIVSPSERGMLASCAESLTMRTIEPGEIVPTVLSLKEEEAQQLCDSLWEAGVRPTNGEGSTGQLAATQAHLDDMRAIAFSHPGIRREQESIIMHKCAPCGPPKDKQ